MGGPTPHRSGVDHLKSGKAKTDFFSFNSEVQVLWWDGVGEAWVAAGHLQQARGFQAVTEVPLLALCQLAAGNNI